LIETLCATQFVKLRGWETRKDQTKGGGREFLPAECHVIFRPLQMRCRPALLWRDLYLTRDTFDVCSFNLYQFDKSAARNVEAYGQVLGQPCAPVQKALPMFSICILLQFHASRCTLWWEESLSE